MDSSTISSATAVLASATRISAAIFFSTTPSAIKLRSSTCFNSSSSCMDFSVTSAFPVRSLISISFLFKSFRPISLLSCRSSNMTSSSFFSSSSLLLSASASAISRACTLSWCSFFKPFRPSKAVATSLWCSSASSPRIRSISSTFLASIHLSFSSFMRLFTSSICFSFSFSLLSISDMSLRTSTLDSEMAVFMVSVSFSNCSF
mmetsp:Transcript_26100/g.49325  ORF Transcript_26100/g.49325 Transcript_26100/m.49325 type:complete len:204 (-) Transcript_26100:2168-2779(-)